MLLGYGTLIKVLSKKQSLLVDHRILYRPTPLTGPIW